MSRGIWRIVRGCGHLRRSRLAVEGGVDRGGLFERDSSDAGQFLLRRGPDGADAAEVGDEGLLAGRADARDAVEYRALERAAPELVVVGEGEAMGLVAEALEEIESDGITRQAVASCAISPSTASTNVT